MDAEKETESDTMDKVYDIASKGDEMKDATIDPLNVEGNICSAMRVHKFIGNSLN